LTGIWKARRMTLDPQIKALLDAMEAMDRPALSEGTAEQGRAAFRELLLASRSPESVVPVGAVEETTVDGGAGELAARVYRPERTGAAPTLVFFHGGGFVIGDLDTHDNTARTLCRNLGAVVLSVDYRLAPEHKWPAAVEDSVAATRWALAHVDSLGSDLSRVAVGGDSAGGNLAAVVAQVFRDDGGPALAAQLLAYPATDMTGRFPSVAENADGYFLTADDMAWFHRHYAPEGEAPYGDSRFAPLAASSLADLPPAIVVTAQFDPLRDEGQAYAERLRADGVEVRDRCFDTLIHGFLSLGPLSAGAQQAVDETCAMFAELLAR
jgi:acetyl esterase